MTSLSLVHQRKYILVNNTILYPFRADTDLRAGYSWSAELSRRLKLKLLLFSTITPNTSESFTDIYHALSDAHGNYIKNFQLLHQRLMSVKSERNFLIGEFIKAFQDFTNQNQPYIIVMQSDVFPNHIMKRVIDSGRSVIVLSPKEILKSPITRKDQSQSFITMLQHAALYNISNSFFKAISEDNSLHNQLAALFKP